MKFEQLLDEIGGLGRMQYFVMMQVAIASVNAAVQVFIQMFIEGNENYRCLIERCENKSNAVYNEKWLRRAVPYNLDDKFENTIPSQCHTFLYNGSLPNSCDFDDVVRSVKVKCDAWVYETVANTLDKQFDLVCDRRNLLDISIVVYICGVLVGTLLLGILADKFGRRRISFIPIIILLVSISSTSLAPNVYVYTVLRFFTGLCVMGINVVAFVLLSEICGRKNKAMLIAASYGQPLGEFLIIGVAHISYDWRYVQAVTIIPALLFIPYFCLIPESPRWLISEGKFLEAEQQIRKLAKWQGRSAPADLLCKLKETKENQSNAKRDFFALFRTSEIRKRFLVVASIWMCASLTSYGISLGARRLPGKLHTTFSFLTVADVVGITACLYVVHNIGRKASLFIGFASLTILYLINTFNPPGQIHEILIAVFGRFFVEITFNVTYVFTAELFPTSIRSTALGTASAFSRIAEMSAPYVCSSANLWRPSPSIILSGGSLICAFVVLLLPETCCEDFPATIEEVENQDGNIEIQYVHTIT